MYAASFLCRKKVVAVVWKAVSVRAIQPSGHDKIFVKVTSMTTISSITSSVMTTVLV